MFSRLELPVLQWLRLGFIVTISGLILLLGFMLSDLYTRLQQIRGAPRDNVQWTLLQVQNEFTKFYLSVTEAEQTGDLKQSQMHRRFDILYSRIELLRTAPVFKFARADAEFAEYLLKAKAYIDELVPIVDSSPDTIIQRLPELHRRTEAIEPTVQSMVLRAVKKSAEVSDSERQQFIDFIYKVGLTILLLIVALTAGVAFLTKQESRLRNREIALIESRRRMAATNRASLDAIIVADAAGHIIDFNDAAVRCFGYTREQVIGRDMATLVIPERHREAHKNAMVRFLAMGETKVIGRRIEIEALHAEGHEFPVELAVGVADTKSGPIFVAYLRDITDRREAEYFLKIARDKAEAGGKAKERFLAVMSHEMRTPLNGILGVLDLLKQTDLNGHQHRFVETALHSGEALQSLISDVLDLSKLNSEAPELDPNSFALDAMVANALSITSSLAKKAGNTVSVLYGEGVPQWVLADEGRLRQVLLNLLSNASKFTTGGKITVSVVKTGGSEEKPLLEFSVRDTGIGIDPARAGELFKDFATLDDSYQRKVGGTGLGLAICKRIIVAMGGEIGAEGEKGKGSRFWFKVPLQKSTAPEVLPKASTDTSETGRKLRILVVEDNPTNQMVTRGMLEGAGHAVTTASDGVEGVIAATAEVYDLILMDISMPNMDGIEATQQIRSKPGPHGRVPVVALTANTLSEDVDRFIAAGMDGFLSKPIRKTALLKKVEEFATAPAIVLEIPDAPEEKGHHMIDQKVFGELSEEMPPELIPQILQQFLTELQDRLRMLQKAMTDGDEVSFKKICHSISGSSATIGGMALAGIAKELEILCAQQQGADALKRFDEIARLAAETEGAVKQLLVDHPADRMVA